MSKRARRGRSARGERLRGWRRLLAGVGLGALLVASGIVGFWLWSRRKGDRGEVIAFDVQPGVGVAALRDSLERAGVLDEPALFEAYAAVTRTPARLKPGPHLLRGGLSPAELVARLTRSAARPRVKLTIPEGYNRFQLSERVEKLELASAASFIAATENGARLAELGVPGPSAEGYLFPATYELHVDSDPELIVSTLVREAKKRISRLNERVPGRMDELRRREGWGEREVLTLASIVEKEAADSREHGNISSVFYNRLNDATFRPKRMLQSDATAAYGCLIARAEIGSCHDFTGLVTPAMLRDTSNPYNTYRHPGLPPGPIASPSESAILSVLDPPTTPFFFFVAGAAKRHVFSRTLSEHERAIVTGLPSAAAETASDD